MNTPMKRHDCIFWFLLLCCMMSNMAFGHDFEAVNDDGVTIYSNAFARYDQALADSPYEVAPHKVNWLLTGRWCPHNRSFSCSCS